MNESIRLADTHCHLYWRDFDEDRDAVMARAREAGVELFVCPGTNLDTSREAVELARRYDGVLAAVGVHPNDAQGFDAAMLERLRTLASDRGVAAIGEVGMDFHWDRLPPKAQREAFEMQMDLAGALSLPVIVHNRDAHDTVLETLETRTRTPRGVVLHSFSGGLDEARRALDLGAYLGIAGPVTFRNAGALRDVVRWAPIDRLLLETDAPFLTPVPHRGKRNEPANLRWIAEEVARLKSLPLAVVAEETLAAARQVFVVGDAS